MKLTILMPALNEEEGIGKTIQAIPFQALQKMGYETEVLVVDGKSEDKTREIAQKMGAKVIISERGYGRQYKVGFKKAKGEIIVTADSDNSYPMSQIPELLEIFQKENLDFLTTNRFAFLEKEAMRSLNWIGNKILTFFLNLLFGLNLKDSQSGMWVIRKSALKKLNLKSNDMPFSQELKIEAFKKLKAKEVPSSYKKRLGQTKLKSFRHGLINLYQLFKKRIEML